MTLRTRHDPHRTSWALFSDIDITSEKYRCCGGFRFTARAVELLFCDGCVRPYQGTLHYLPDEAGNAMRTRSSCVDLHKRDLASLRPKRCIHLPASPFAPTILLCSPVSPKPLIQSPTTDPCLLGLNDSCTKAATSTPVTMQPGAAAEGGSHPGLHDCNQHVPPLSEPIGEAHRAAGWETVEAADFRYFLAAMQVGGRARSVRLRGPVTHGSPHVPFNADPHGTRLARGTQREAERRCDPHRFCEGQALLHALLHARFPSRHGNGRPCQGENSGTEDLFGGGAWRLYDRACICYMYYLAGF